MRNLTDKMEMFCQHYVLTGNKSAAYRESYSTSNMKPKTINRKGTFVSQKPQVKARIEELQKEASERNKIDLDQLIQMLSSMARFDIGDLYDKDGALRNIKNIPKEARLMIEQLDTLEEKGDRGVVIGHIQKIRTLKKLDAIEKLMKHLGGYEIDNKQKTPVPELIIRRG